MLVSVVVPCHNSRAYVGKALDSVFAQTHTDLELICVDDGSRDGTPDLLEEIRHGSVIPMKVVRLERNRGACAARNVGLEISQGTYVQFLDSDDLIHADKIEHQLNLIEQEEAPVDLVAADSICFSIRKGTEFIRRVDRRGPFFGLVGSRLGITSANLWRREALQRVGGFNVQLRTSNEYELMFRMLQDGAHTLLDPVAKTVVRHRSGSLTQTDRRDFILRFLRLRRDMLQYAEMHGLAAPGLSQHAHDVMFREIRQLWRYDPRAAEQVYRELLPPRFVPTRESVGLRYRTLVTALGFARAQRVAPVIGLSR